MTIIKAVFDFFLIKRSDFQVFSHSHVHLLPPSPCLFPLPALAPAHAHLLFSVTPALPVAHILGQILISCRSTGWKGHPLEKSEPATRMGSSSCSPGGHSEEQGADLNPWANTPGRGGFRCLSPEKVDVPPTKQDPL